MVQGISNRTFSASNSSYKETTQSETPGSLPKAPTTAQEPAVTGAASTGNSSNNNNNSGSISGSNSGIGNITGLGGSYKRGVTDRIPQLRFAANKVGLKSLPMQTEISWGRKGVKFSLILAGCRGTGKTTFLNTLIGETMEEESRPHINGQVRSRRFFLVENKFDMELTVVDMPDFAAKIDNHYTWLPIVKYIEYQFRQYLLQEEQPVREHIRDERVHVCVYFISPTNTQLSTLDIESMREISKRVSLVPVIARSDTLNKEELANFKTIINKTLADNDIDVCKYLSDSHVVDKLNAHSPFAIIGSNAVYKNSEGKLVRARKYGWGMVEVENPDHCDFIHMRDLLMSENMLDLMTALIQYYNAFRCDLLRSRIRSLRKSGDDSEFATSNEDGMVSYKLYNLLLSRESQFHLEKYSGEEEALQKECRARLEGFRTAEEQRLRDCKRRLTNIQVTHNADLEVEMGKVSALEKAILALNPNENENLKEIAERASMVTHQKLAGDQESLVAPSVTVL